MEAQDRVRVTLRCSECGGVVTEKDGGFWNRNSKFCAACESQKKGKGWKKEGEYVTVYTTDCPYCGASFEIPGEDPRGQICPVCKNAYPSADRVAKVVLFGDIPDAADDPGVIMLHPATLFNAQTILHSGAGVTAILTQGQMVTALDPRAQRPFQALAGDRVITGQLVFVRNRVRLTFPCGTPGALRVFSPREHLTGELVCAGEVAVEIADAVPFCRWARFTPCTVRTLTQEDDPLIGLHAFIRQAFTESARAALETAVGEQGVLIDELKANETAVLSLVVRELNKRLQGAGLRASMTNWAGFEVKKSAVISRLKERVERLVEWNTERVPVHERDQAQLRAEVLMAGTAQIRLENMATLMGTADGQRWNDPLCPDGRPGEELGKQIGDHLNAMFMELLQRMIDDTGAPVRRLNQFLPYLQNTMLEYLNKSPFIASRGLAVESITVRVRQTDLSIALARREDTDEAIAVARIEEEMRRFNDSLTITQARDSSTVRIQLGAIQQRETEAVYGQKKAVDDIETRSRLDQIARQRTVDQVEQQAAIEKTQLDMERHAVAEDMNYDLSMKRRARYEESEDHKSAREHARQVQSLERAYEQWKLRQRQEREQLESTLEKERALLAHRQDLAEAVGEAQRKDLTADANLKASIHEILRGIEESDLDWEKKLDAYARLKAVTQADDELSLRDRSTRLDIDLADLAQRSNLNISRETIEQLELSERYAEERQERVSKAEFLRDMEKQRYETAVEIELLRLEMEKEKAEQDLAFRMRQQDQEYGNDRLRMQLNHSEKQAETAAERDKKKFEADVSIHEAAFDYQRYQETNRVINGFQQDRIDELKAEKNRKESADRDAARKAEESEERRRIEEVRLIEKNQDRIERLYNAVIDMERQRDEIDGAIEWSRQKELIRGENNAREQAKASKINEMFAFIKKLAEDVRKLGAKPAPAAPATPVPPAGAATTRLCPYCGAELDLYRTICPRCNRTILRP